MMAILVWTILVIIFQKYFDLPGNGYFVVPSIIVFLYVLGEIGASLHKIAEAFEEEEKENTQKNVA
jgi:hypothetical protein